MQDARWSQLKQYLLERGWTSRNDALYAPHETMWFATSTANPDLALFRDRMSLAADATSEYVTRSVEQADLHDDLVSLVGALDDVLEN
jgi:hypothetical protein